MCTERLNEGDSELAAETVRCYLSSLFSGRRWLRRYYATFVVTNKVVKSVSASTIFLQGYIITNRPAQGITYGKLEILFAGLGWKKSLRVKATDV